MIQYPKDKDKKKTQVVFADLLLGLGIGSSKEWKGIKR